MSPADPQLFTALDNDYLRQSIDRSESEITRILEPLEPQSATLAWFETLRAIEEWINFLTYDWDDEAAEMRLSMLPTTAAFHSPERLVAVRADLIARFSEPFANRFTHLLIRGGSVGPAFALHGMLDVAGAFETVGSMIAYLMSRRRHFVALLHALPQLCRGRQIVQPLETFNLFLPLIEIQGLSMVGAHQALLVNASQARLGIYPKTDLDFRMLDPMFLEPERLRITDAPLTEAGVAMLDQSEKLARDRLFSAAELRNDILALEAAYAEFDLANTRFAPAAEFVRRISRDYVNRDFWVEISPAALDALSIELNLPANIRAALTNQSSTYQTCLATYAPLVLVGGTYRSTVTLLSRFMYYWRAVALDRNKRFQIRAGFIFEQAVAKALRQQGFGVHDITRINRHEFDVVTSRDEIIWNIQCKNNFLDIERLEEEPFRFAKYNARLVRSYERALLKERNREGMLLAKLSLERIEHLVVSRFPVITDNIRMLPFSRIAQFSDVTNSLKSAGFH